MFTKLAIELTEMEKKHSKQRVRDMGVAGSVLGGAMMYSLFGPRGAAIVAPIGGLVGAGMARSLRNPEALRNRILIKHLKEQEKERGKKFSKKELRAYAGITTGLGTGLGQALSAKFLNRFPTKTVAGLGGIGTVTGGVFGALDGGRTHELLNAK